MRPEIEIAMIENAARAIWKNQHRKVKGVNANRAWRSPDVPEIFWQGYVEDAHVALAVFVKQNGDDQ